jgi:hypothetical protein
MSSEPPMVMLSFRVPAPMKAELEALAEDASPSPGGRRPDRSDVARRMLADGIRRARVAHRHPARLPGDLQPPRD